MPADLAMLMKSYCEGDREAFNQLYEIVAPKLLRYLTRLSGDRSTAEDLLQLSFLKVHRARASYVEGAKPLPWMYTIAHRTFLDETRKRKRAKVVEVEEVPDVPVNLQGQASDGHTEETSERLAAALEALQTLPASQRQAVVLTKLDGKSMTEAAEIAGTSAGAMKVRAHRGYAALRERLTGRKGGDA